jgi:hypothetical protein
MKLNTTHLKKKLESARVAAAKAVGNPRDEDVSAVRNKSKSECAHAAYIHIQVVENMLKELGVLENC